MTICVLEQCVHRRAEKTVNQNYGPYPIPSPTLYSQLPYSLQPSLRRLLVLSPAPDRAPALEADVPRAGSRLEPEARFWVLLAEKRRGPKGDVPPVMRQIGMHIEAVERGVLTV